MQVEGQLYSIILEEHEKGNPPFSGLPNRAVSDDRRKRKSGQGLTPCGIIEGTAVIIVAPLQRRKAQRFFSSAEGTLAWARGVLSAFFFLRREVVILLMSCQALRGAKVG
jgi:hypothetical protein